MRSRTQLTLAWLFTSLAACAGPGASGEAGPASATPSPAPSASADAPPPGRRTLSIVGTNDLHGRIGALPLFGGFLANLRAARAADGGGVLLVDGGDLFQGTLESNLVEGRSVIQAYAALGYHAATVGNHEFDFGPVGPDATPRNPGDDPRGALKALAREAPFPLLVGNVLDRASGARVDWPRMPASAVVELAGARVGLVGITTEETLTTTIRANVADLDMAPLAETVTKEAARLRAEERCELVVVLAHAGGKCARFGGTPEADGCEMGSEIFRVARALPAGAVDAIVAGHTHAGVAHEVANVPILEQFAYGRAFGRVDLVIEGRPARVVDRVMHAPRDLCPGQKEPDWTACDAGSYEGRPVARDEAVGKVVAPALAAAQGKREELLGVVLTGEVKKSYDEESALGNLYADLLLAATPGADVGLMNGGGLRAPLPAGPLKYGALFESFPFDNRVATAKLRGAELEQLVREHLGRGGGVLSFAGVEVEAKCRGASLEVKLTRRGKPLARDAELTIVGSDFLLTGGDAFWGDAPAPPIDVKDELMRDALERRLRATKEVDPKALFDAQKRRLRLASPRPLRCTGR